VRDKSNKSIAKQTATTKMPQRKMATKILKKKTWKNKRGQQVLRKEYSWRMMAWVVEPVPLRMTRNWSSPIQNTPPKYQLQLSHH